MRTAVIFIFFAVINLFILFPSESPVPQASRPPNYITLTLSRCFCISLFPPPPVLEEDAAAMHSQALGVLLARKPRSEAAVTLGGLVLPLSPHSGGDL